MDQDDRFPKIGTMYKQYVYIHKPLQQPIERVCYFKVVSIRKDNGKVNCIQLGKDNKGKSMNLDFTDFWGYSVRKVTDKAELTKVNKGEL